MAKAKSKQQIRFLLSSGSSLSMAERSRLKRELSRGEVTVKNGSKRRKAK